MRSLGNCRTATLILLLLQHIAIAIVVVAVLVRAEQRERVAVAEPLIRKVELVQQVETLSDDADSDARDRNDERNGC